jgi:ribosomal protein L16/L10AE
MGKGKGALNRYCARVFQNHNLLEFSGFNLHEVKILKKILKKKLNIPTKINSYFFLNKGYNYTNSNQNFFFFKNYLS